MQNYPACKKLKINPKYTDSDFHEITKYALSIWTDRYEQTV